MARRSGALVTSAAQVDPLSWFTGPVVPLFFSTLIVFYGITIELTVRDLGAIPALQTIALILTAGAGVLIQIVTRPLRQPISWGWGAIALTVSVSGVVLSAAGLSGSTMPTSLWWAPGALALTIGSLGPYLPVRQLLVLGSAATIVAVAAGLYFLRPPVEIWGHLGTAVVIAYPPVLGIVATASFAYTVVRRMLIELASPSRIFTVGQAARDAAADEVERVTLSQLTNRAVPFLEAIIERGTVTPSDRVLAGQLARRLRDDLVTQSGLSWLDSVASESRLVVLDPDRLARRMNNAQRTALRGMLRGILEIDGTDSGSLMIELRRAPDGATAVAVSMDQALPDGRRITHLAPYYLTLRTAVENLTIETDRLLKLSFRIPADTASPEDRG
jgi:hypothetical protein